MRSLNSYVENILINKQEKTLLGIGPMSKSVIEASLELAKQYNFPIMFIASRNQVDSDDFGSGYVNNWNAQRFVSDIKNIAERISFSGDYYVCRDHGGPWQRDEERRMELPQRVAMEIAKKSYAEDIQAGFDLLHIDPTKIPNCNGMAPMDDVIEMTIELIEFCENERKRFNKSNEFSYEIGTEETNGGLTGNREFEYFINTLFEKLNARSLPRPLFIVGQIGTLVKMTENVGQFNIKKAKELSDIARKYNIGLKEHNCDYIAGSSLCAHPVVGVTASNVAPEFGFAETCALIELCDLEDKLYDSKFIEEKSEFYKCILKKSVECKRWKKWILEDLTIKQIFNDQERARKIVHLAGHYTYNDQQIVKKRALLYSNLEKLGIHPHRIVLEKIKDKIKKYAVAFNLVN